MRKRLSLKAEDADDLQIVSATLQDAIVRVKDIHYDAKARIFTAVFNRYRWEDAPKRPRAAPGAQGQRPERQCDDARVDEKSGRRHGADGAFEGSDVARRLERLNL